MPVNKEQIESSCFYSLTLLIDENIQSKSVKKNKTKYQEGCLKNGFISTIIIDEPNSKCILCLAILIINRAMIIQNYPEHEDKPLQINLFSSIQSDS